MKKLKAVICVLGAICAGMFWQESSAQTPAQKEMLDKIGKDAAENAKAQQDMMDKLRKETEERNRALSKPMVEPLGGMGNAKLEPLKPRALEPGSSKPREAAAPASTPSRVTYGETRRLSGQRELPDEEAPKPKPAAAKPPVPEKPPCVYKPVMTDADLAACR